jgi:hypothetical protein
MIYYTQTSIVVTDDTDAGRPPLVLPLPGEFTAEAIAAIEAAIAAYLPLLPADPDWAGFLSQLLDHPGLAAAMLGAEQLIAAELPTAAPVRREQLLVASTVLRALPAVLVAAAGSGGPALFLSGWQSLQAASLVNPDVAAAIAAVARSHALPGDVIAVLEGQP